MLRLISRIAMVVVLSAGMGSAAAAQEATPAAELAPTGGAGRTNIRYFLPFTGDGLNSALTVSASESGTCVHESLAAPGRPDAWGCIGAVSNQIFDPCFENPFSTPDEPGELACIASPFDREVVLLAPTAPLPRLKEAEGVPAPGEPKGNVAKDDPEPPSPADASDPLPWALALVNGETCTLATGATAVFAGMRINYFCSGGGTLLGAPDRGLPVWAVTYLPDGAFTTDLMDVAAVWL